MFRSGQDARRKWSVLLLEDFPGNGDCSDGVGPAGIERQVSDGLNQLFLRQTILARADEVRSQLVGSVHCDERADGGKAAIAFGKLRTLPDVTKEHVVGQLYEFRRDVAHQPLRWCGLRA
jgi:hypothetical protein